MAPADALSLAASAAVRVRNRKCPVRLGFIDRGTGRGVVSLGDVLRGGQGGEVRLKLLLSLLWMSGNRPHDTTYPARVWAQLLGLPEPDTNGARRITAAITWLENNHLIRTDRTPGLPATVFLLDERGTRDDYVHPGEAQKLAADAGDKADPSGLWVSLPAEFWTKGWITILDGPAVAMLLALLAEARRYGRSENLWFSMSQGLDRFDLSSDTRNEGLRELEHRWLVLSTKKSVSRDAFDYRKVRKTYALRLQQLVAGPDTRVHEDSDFGRLAELLASFTKDTWTFEEAPTSPSAGPVEQATA